MKSYDVKIPSLKLEIKGLGEKWEAYWRFGETENWTGPSWHLHHSALAVHQRSTLSLTILHIHLSTTHTHSFQYSYSLPSKPNYSITFTKHVTMPSACHSSHHLTMILPIPLQQSPMYTTFLFNTTCFHILIPLLIKPIILLPTHPTHILITASSHYRTPHTHLPLYLQPSSYLYVQLTHSIFPLHFAWEWLIPSNQLLNPSWARAIASSRLIFIHQICYCLTHRHTLSIPLIPCPYPPTHIIPILHAHWDISPITFNAATGSAYAKCGNTRVVVYVLEPRDVPQVQGRPHGDQDRSKFWEVVPNECDIDPTGWYVETSDSLLERTNVYYNEVSCGDLLRVLLSRIWSLSLWTVCALILMTRSFIPTTVFKTIWCMIQMSLRSLYRMGVVDWCYSRCGSQWGW